MILLNSRCLGSPEHAKMVYAMSDRVVAKQRVLVFSCSLFRKQLRGAGMAVDGIIAVPAGTDQLDLLTRREVSEGAYITASVEFKQISFAAG